jgi:hypothetical protein
MFGGLTFLLNGNMCCGILENDLVLRVGPGKAGGYLQQPHVQPMDITGKPLDWMIRISPQGYASRTIFEQWLQGAVDYASSLPPKQPLESRRARVEGKATGAKSPRVTRPPR